MNNINRTITKKGTQSKQFSAESDKVTSYYLNVTDPSCREKAHDKYSVMKI